MVKPYIDCDDGRIFPVDVLEEDLIWHRDKEDRVFTVLEGSGWGFQLENGLPFELNLGDEVCINKFTYHRLIKGNTKLKLNIQRGSHDY